MFAGHDGASGTKQVSEETPLAFESGKAIQYSAAAENGANLKNYWVTFLTRQSGPKLFVNAINDTSHYDEDTNLPVREVFLTNAFDFHHDVFFANIGDEDITGLYVRLEDAKNIALDEYWTVGATTTLKSFTPETISEPESIGKIRLVPAKDADGKPMYGDISGTLVIGHTAGSGEEIKIKLTGVAGVPKITTTSVVGGVKYVPYSSVIQTNNMYDSDDIKFTLAGGRLPSGMVLKASGELYGVPKQAGTFNFTAKATSQTSNQSDSKSFTLTILENTDENVNATNSDAQGYTLLDAVDSQIDVTVVSDGEVFRSEGAYGEFMGFYLDGKKLVEGEDYNSSEGSTKITIRTQTFKNAGNGAHTIAAEFRSGGSELGTMKRTAQNVKVSGVKSVSSGGNSSVTYQISANSAANGTVSVSPTKAAAGKTIIVNVKPNEGYAVKNIEAGGVELKKVSDTQYTFVMPKADVTVSAVFEEIMPDPATELPFIDIDLDDWYFDAVKYVYENDLMVGTSEKKFDPDMTLTRGMIVTALYRMAEAEPVEGECPFADVAEDTYYYEAVKWAASAGIIYGYGDGVFGPNDNISRQQMAAILYRCAEHMGLDVTGRGDLSVFSDIADASCTYSEEALSWAYANGLLVGMSETTMNPCGQANRAQIAMILMRFCEYVKLAQ